MYAGMRPVQKRTTISPVGVGLASHGPTGVVGLTITTS